MGCGGFVEGYDEAHVVCADGAGEEAGGGGERGASGWSVLCLSGRAEPCAEGLVDGCEEVRGAAEAGECTVRAAGGSGGYFAGSEDTHLQACWEPAEGWCPEGTHAEPEELRSETFDAFSQGKSGKCY